MPVLNAAGSPSVSAAQEATAVIIDIRSYTARLQDYLYARDHLELPRVISDFVTSVVEICRRVCGEGPCDHLHLAPVGDGVLTIFLRRPGEPASHHALRAYLAALEMVEVLPGRLAEDNVVGRNAYDYQFGIAMESGTVEYAGFQHQSPDVPNLDTYLGHCVNVASRLEGLNKSFDRTCVLLGEQVNLHLVDALTTADYKQLRARSLDSSSSQWRDSWAKMKSINEDLMIDYLAPLSLEGCDEPVMSYRLSPSLFEVNRDVVMARCREALGLPMREKR